MKSSPSIWRYVVNVKSMVKISSIFVAFLENKNFKSLFGFLNNWKTLGMLLLFYNIVKNFLKKLEFSSKKHFAPLWISDIASFDRWLDLCVLPHT